MYSFSDLFKGRLGRAHFAWTVLAYFAVAVVLNILAAVLSSVGDSLGALVGIVAIIVYVAMLVIGIGVSIRRYHDLDWSGWLVLLSFVPFVNFVMLLIQLFKAGTPGNNRFGSPLPKEVPLLDAVLGKTMAAATRDAVAPAQGGTPAGNA